MALQLTYVAHLIFKITPERKSTSMVHMIFISEEGAEVQMGCSLPEALLKSLCGTMKNIVADTLEMLMKFIAVHNVD